MAEAQLIQINQASQIEILGQQIATNHLIVEQIVKHLNKEDLLVFSSINKTWNKVARACLNKKHKCQIILCKEPCRALLALNALLQNQNTSFYNGIKHYYGGKNPDKFGLPFGRAASEYCYKKCLSKEDKKFDLDSVCLMYSNILKCIRFEYIKFTDNGRLACPFMQLIHIILKEKGYFMKEFRTNSRRYNTSFWQSIMEQRIYPHLHTIDASNLKDSIVINSLPNVRRIFNGFVSPFYSVDGEKSHLFTRTDICDSRHPFFYTTVRPIWQLLQVRLSTSVGNFTDRFLWASKSICYTLKELHCCLTILADLSNFPSMPQFWALKTVSSGVQGLIYNSDWSYLIKTVNWDHFAPNLHCVNFAAGNFRTPQDRLIKKPTDMHEQFQSLSTRKLLALDKDIEIDIIADTFPNILELVQELPKKFDIFEQTAIFPYLNELSLGLYYEKHTNLDFLLDMHEDEIEEIGKLSFKEIQRLSLFSNKHSILNRTGLQRLTIYWHVLNTELRKNILSAGAAALISAKMPGFCLDLSFDRRFPTHLPWRNPRIDTDHLTPYARVQKIYNEEADYNQIYYRILFKK